MEGLVDSSSLEDFDAKFKALQEHWNERESPYAGENGAKFYDYFQCFYADVVCHHIRKDLREAAGLGSPPPIFTTNSSELLNAVLKSQVNHKKINGLSLCKK